MKAVNPNTGKPIKIMRTETYLTKTNRTLLWHTHTLSDSPRWQRWSVLVTDFQSLKTQPKPEIVFIYDLPSEEAKITWAKWLKTSTNETLVIVMPDVITELHLNDLQMENMLCISEIHDRYPFLPAIKSCESIELWVSVIANLMRFHCIVSTIPIENSSFDGKIQVIDKAANATEVVPPIYLIQQYTDSKKNQRQKEINMVLKKNLECDYIDKIILLNERQFNFPEDPKLEQIVIGKHMTYYDVFKYIKTNITKETFVVVSNSDIYLDNTLCALYSIYMNKRFLALLRYDDKISNEHKLFSPRPDSQDTWMFSSSSLDFEPNQTEFGFQVGAPGSDNAIGVAMFKKHFLVANPSLTIKTYRINNSNTQPNDKADLIDKPVFLYLDPTAIQEYTPVSDLKAYQDKSWIPCSRRSFVRPIKYVDQTTVATICNMLCRNSEYKFSIDSANTYNQGIDIYDSHLYKFEGDIFTMPSGVVCNKRELYIGNHKTWKDEWLKQNLTVLTNTTHVPELCAVYLPKDVAISPAKWFLHYLPYVLSIRKHINKQPDFIIPDHPDTQKALQTLKWPEMGTVSMVPYMDDSQLYSQTVYSLTPTTNQDVTAENIEILRSLIPEKTPNTCPVVLIIVERDNNKIFTNAWATEVIRNLFTRGTWETHIVDADMNIGQRLDLVMRADIMIAPSNSDWEALDWSWMMKPGKCVMELMEDARPRGDHIHLAGAANLNYILLGVKREPLPYQRQHAIEDIDKALKAHVFADSLKATVPNSALPRIIMPTGDALSGIYSHDGDNFRELVEIWEMRGYVNVERRRDTPHVWWGSIGDVLLYDRKTLKWFLQNQPSYKLGLFGNCLPENISIKDKLWSYWGRHPKALEKATLNNSKNYNNRKIKSVFIGRVENGVQQEKRSKHDWSTALELFSMPVDSSSGPYKYTQEQYLEILSNTRFGLCLPGFGAKCNREIEYFAMGTVPIITPGVDMTYYAARPQKNIHYFEASTPEEVQKIVNETSLEKWTEMSISCRAWWRRYASAEGLFRLTWGIINTTKSDIYMN